MRLRRALPLLLLGTGLIVSGCTDWKAEIDSNTSWYAVFGGVTTSGEWTTSEMRGTGDKTIDLPDDMRVCCVVWQQASGYVKVNVKDDGGGPFHIFAEKGRKSETNVSGGRVEMCNEGTVPVQYSVYDIDE
jgi:hypothetical protein